MCCMDRHLQTVRGFRPHGSLHVSTHMGDITVEKVVGHPSIDISSIGGSIELLMESAAFSGESLSLPLILPLFDAEACW